MTIQVKEVELGLKGRVVIPAEIRAALGIKTGDKIVFVLDGEEVKMTTRRAAIARIRGKYAIPGRSLTDELLAERRAEAEAKGW